MAEKSDTGSVGSPDDFVDPFENALTSAWTAAVAESAGDPKVIAAVEVGWLMRELTAGWLPEIVLAEPPLTPSEQYAFQALRLSTLLTSLKLDGLATADVDSVSTALQSGAAPEAAAKLEPKVIVAMVGADARFAKAYALGKGVRGLIPPTGALTEKPDTQSLIGALDSLSSALPSHAARAVANSLADWAESKQGLTKSQVDLWRSVIVGEKKGTELLEPQDYLAAARQLEARFFRRFATSPWLLLAAGLVLALFAGSIVLLFLAHGQADKLAAGASGVLAALGLTWKGIGGTVGKIVGKLEAPLWGAELDTAITDALNLWVAPKNKRARVHGKGLDYDDRRGRAA
jgi:hypothetical protein